MEPWFQVVLTIFSSVLASSGLWAYLQKKSEQKDVKTEMLIGLAHDRIMYLGMSYIDRGCVTQDEYENLRVSLRTLRTYGRERFSEANYAGGGQTPDS